MVRAKKGSPKSLPKAREHHFARKQTDFPKGQKNLKRENFCNFFFFSEKAKGGSTLVLSFFCPGERGWIEREFALFFGSCVGFLKVGLVSFEVLYKIFLKSFVNFYLFF